MRIPKQELGENFEMKQNIAHMIFDGPTKFAPESDQSFFGHGKLLLSGEYFVLDGAKALALPTSVGQSMSVKYSNSYDPYLYWKSYDVKGEIWFETKFEFWRFNFVQNDAPSAEELILQKILRQARVQNNHFLRDDMDVTVETNLGFPLEWGLGTSSTLIYNMAQWAYISPFQLLFKTYGGSGYDIACAQSEGPIVYTRQSNGPSWATLPFDPSFKSQLYFVYLGNKQSSQAAITNYKALGPFSSELIQTVSHLTDQMIAAPTLDSFAEIMCAHEDLVAENLNMKKVKDLYFSDYWGEVKSLGAWGGDFVLVTSNKSKSETRKYFLKKGLEVFIPYTKLILENSDRQIMAQPGQIEFANVH